LQTSTKLQQFTDDVLQNPHKYGKYTRLAVERFIKDLLDKDSEFVFNEEKGQRAVDFIERLNQTKGQWARQPLVLLPWQHFIVMNLFSWVHKETGYRRFNVAYISMARKNGKSTLISAIALYMLRADHEESAEIYCAANSREQASMVFDQVKDTINRTPGLLKSLDPQHNAIHHRKSLSFLKKVSNESRTLDGLNVHCAILDEIHEFKNDKLWNVFRGGMGSRRQPLLIGITTAGLDKSRFGFQQEEYTKAVLEGTQDAPNYFGIIFSIDDDDKPEDEATWIKANPNLGISVSLRDLQDQLRESKISAVKLADFMAKKMNRYVSNTGSWLKMETILKAVRYFNDFEEREAFLKSLEGQECYVGFDASQKHDLTAYSLTFPAFNFFTIWRFYLPENGFQERCDYENANYKNWVNAGFLTLTPGDTVDYTYVYERVKEDAERYNIKEFLYDPWKKAEFLPLLIESGVKAVEMPQALKYMAPACSQLTRAFSNGTISMEYNPIALWNLENVEIKPDPNGNFKFLKGSNVKKRIDGAVTLSMSYYRAYLFNHGFEEEEKVKEFWWGMELA